MAKFKEFLGNDDWHDFYNTEDQSKMLNTLYKMYNNAFNKVFPIKQLSHKRVKDKLWITTSLIKCIHHKEKLFQNYVLHPNSANKQAFTKYKNIITSCLRKAEDNHFKDIINSEKQNLYKLWTTIGNIINPSKQKQKN